MRNDCCVNWNNFVSDSFVDCRASTVRTIDVIVLSSVELLVDNYFGLRPRFAGLDALVPRVMKFCVTSTSAMSEPRTAATATTDFAGFADGAAFGAYGIDDRRRVC